MSDHTLVLFIQAISLAACTLLAVKLYKTGLYRRYQAFFWYFIFRVVNGIWPLFLDLKSDAYFYFWIASSPLTLVFYVWVVFELCRLVLEKHRGLYSLGRWAMAVGMVVSVTLSILSLLPKLATATRPQSKYLGYFYATDRGVTFALAIFLLLMMFLLSRYPVPLSRNVILHATLYTLFFLSNTLNVILNSVFGIHLYTVIDMGLMVISTGCVVSWLLFFNPNGEEVRIRMPHFGIEHEERLLFQLDALNSTLLKVARK